ncbi:DoxX family protein [Actinocrispum wychmicini]|uniref:DoxX-like protein n=1 Tax=Actinocrispum wychmicini TaxID=1213861 RepID=A0A4R2J342_9PSEU|nr:DoxX family protein [Actinocrispum wychmicini]TCO52324.1 DoxX-like protein [Actinocrispum wychmicini]
MFTAYVAVAAVTAAVNIAAAIANFVRAKSILENMTSYGVPRSWLFWLGMAKAAGAAGILVGFAVPAIGIAAAAGLVLFFIGAVITVIRAQWYKHVPFPGTFLLLAAGTLALTVHG